MSAPARPPTGAKRTALTLEQREAFGKLLRDKRSAAGLSRRALAEKAKLSDATIKFLETARHPPSRATLIRLVAVWELHLSWDEVPGQPVPPVSPRSDPPPVKTADLNWYVPPSYDSLGMVTELGRFLRGAGGYVEQTSAYLDHHSAAAYLAVCAQPLAQSLRASLPLAAAAQHIATRTGAQPLTLIALGAGDAVAEVRLLQHLLEHGRAPRVELCLLDISQPLLSTGFRHAVEAVGALSNVRVWGMQANFHHLPEYPLLERRLPERRLFCMLGGTLANLDHEPRFFRHSLRGNPGDLLLLDIPLACGSASDPEDLKQRDSGWSAGISPAQATWLGGPLWRHCPDTTHVTFRWELDTRCPIPGSYALEAVASVQSRERPERQFSLFRFRRYEPRRLTECLRALGWEPIVALPYGPDDNPASLALFVARGT
jgi:transcriptional regulator with XRE-family HTH domain